MTTVVIAAAIYIVITFGIAYVWHLRIFAERYRMLQIYRDDPKPVFGLASMVIQGLAFGLVYVALFMPMTGGWLAKAAEYAAFGGIFSWSFTTLATAAKSRMTSIGDYVTIETAFTVVQWIAVAARDGAASFLGLLFRASFSSRSAASIRMSSPSANVLS